MSEAWFDTHRAVVHPWLAVMHGASFQGDGRSALYELASGYEQLMAVAHSAAAE